MPWSQDEPFEMRQGADLYIAPFRHCGAREWIAMVRAVARVDDGRPANLADQQG